ncbi:MAG: hypothetical protein UT34_C0002G0232 [candidate division WS6 bacterium GW2011_GWF2_39_15]|uniref:DUF5667 domain-containing protein n=1 Tax=candidate division WS6 bacterium GW2011_GWF2_39_15 TaxID=1619100 RepID=A0A0G0Q5N8_9BACT|nr:MAG: hypothetical protein UT34_C0002G0232 [candidate division WS6 bacterium GW2011_GWF2_39_15]
MKRPSKNPLLIVSLSLVALLLLGTGVTYASDGAKPGDLLYSVDRLSENVQLALTLDDSTNAELEMKFLEERVEELEEFENEMEDSAEDKDADGSVDGLNQAIENVAKQEVRLRSRYEELKQAFENGEITQEKWMEIEEKYTELLGKKEDKLDQLQELDSELEEKMEERKQEAEKEQAEEEAEEQEKIKEQEREKENKQNSKSDNGDDESKDSEENEVENEEEDEPESEDDNSDSGKNED